MINRLSAALWDERQTMTLLAERLDALRDEVENGSLAGAAALLPTLDPLLDQVRLHALERDLLGSCVANEWDVEGGELLTLAANAPAPAWGEVLTLHVCALHEIALRMQSAGARIRAVLAELHLDVLPPRWPHSTYPEAYVTAEGHGPASSLSGPPCSCAGLVDIA